MGSKTSPAAWWTSYDEQIRRWNQEQMREKGFRMEGVEVPMMRHQFGFAGAYIETRTDGTTLLMDIRTFCKLIVPFIFENAVRRAVEQEMRWRRFVPALRQLERRLEQRDQNRDLNTSNWDGYKQAIEDLREWIREGDPDGS